MKSAEKKETSTEKCQTSVYYNLLPVDANWCFSVNRTKFIKAQQADPPLVDCFSSVAKTSTCPSVYSVNNGVLTRNWCPPSSVSLGWDSVQQVVVPQTFCPQVLSLAHDNFAGHLGIKITYHRILRYFFWPGLKRDMTRFCRSCRVCQVSSKPSQAIAPAAMHPIPVLGEPFEHIILDCVGPLPKSKSRHQYLLTLMCTATHYPEAIPLPKL